MAALTATAPQTSSHNETATVINDFQAKREQALLNEAKGALDVAFPLQKGSHKDVVSYLVYYNHLLAFLADGTQTGVQKQCHLIDKTGHREQPESVKLSNDNGDGVEISFTQDGACGRSDCAHIDEIRFYRC